MKIGICAPACRIEPATAERVTAWAAARYSNRVELRFHPQSFLSAGHFAGEDDARLAALVELANDPELDAIWFARGGYGACRIAEAALDAFGPAARAKTYFGFSDLGFLLGGLQARGIGRPVHGPVVNDVLRDGGEAALARVLGWLIDREAAALEPSLDGSPALAFNLTVLSSLLGTPLEPDFGGRVLMVEEVSEHHYAIDRAFFHVTSWAAVRGAAGLRLGRCTLVPENAPAFGVDEEAIAKLWCERAGLPYLGRADIGHDADNKIVPFG